MSAAYTSNASIFVKAMVLGKAAFGSQLAGLPLGISLKLFCGPSGFATNSRLL
jgi:hypothetical protein